MNIFSFTGNLGKDCRVGTGQTPMVSFGVGVKSGFGDKAQTIWVDCTLWGKQAESRLPDYLLKGQQVAVSGELGTREHEGKTYLTVRADQVTLLGGSQERGPRRGDMLHERPIDHASGLPSRDMDDEIPF